MLLHLNSLILEALERDSHVRRYLNLLKAGVDIKMSFDSKTLTKNWSVLSNYLVPQLQNNCIHVGKEIFFYDIPKDFKKVIANKDKKYRIDHLHTTGRFNITSNGGQMSKQWVIDNKKKLYNGVNCEEYHFYMKDYSHDLWIICDKKDARFTLVAENSVPLIPDLFNEGEFPSEGWFLKEKWVSFERLIQIIHELHEKLPPMYKSKKLMDLNDKTGLFEHVQSFQSFRSPNLS